MVGRPRNVSYTLYQTLRQASRNVDTQNLYPSYDMVEPPVGMHMVIVNLQWLGISFTLSIPHEEVEPSGERISSSTSYVLNTQPSTLGLGRPNV